MPVTAELKTTNYQLKTLLSLWYNLIYLIPLAKTNAVRWLSFRVRITCLVVFFIGSLLPPYVPKAALAPQDVSVATQQFLLVEDGFIMKSSTLTKHGTRRAYDEGVIHIVKAGDSLEKIANRYSLENETIAWANDLAEGASIQPGDELLILPVDGILHTVSRGQSLSRIAQLYDVTQADIAAQNKIQGGLILAGQELIIPGGKPIVGKPTVVAMAEETWEEDKVVDSEVEPVVVDKSVQVALRPSDIVATPTEGVLQKPCSEICFYTQYFHAGHYAVDMQEKGGGPIFAAEAGTVKRSDFGWNGGYGNVIEIDHGNGLVTLYAHNKEHYVKEGEIVDRGEMISWMGNTGRVYGQTGIHVHFEVHLNGVKKNPLLYLE